VQTGLGRTGAFLGAQHDGVEGDAIALAKGLGGGFPIGALLIKERLNGVLSPGTHGSTFGGNPLASRAARTVLAVLDEEKLIEGAVTKGQRLAEGLAALVKEHPTLCAGQRGRGLLQGLTLAQGVDPRAVLGRARAHGLLLTIAGASTLRYTPPLVVGEAEIDEALTITSRALLEMKP
jgi:acetylornithine/N-succinyldiaminopimelate aminotransferase